MTYQSLICIIKYGLEELMHNNILLIVVCSSSVSGGKRLLQYFHRLLSVSLLAKLFVLIFV